MRALKELRRRALLLLWTPQAVCYTVVATDYSEGVQGCSVITRLPTQACSCRVHFNLVTCQFPEPPFEASEASETTHASNIKASQLACAG